MELEEGGLEGLSFLAGAFWLGLRSGSDLGCMSFVIQGEEAVENLASCSF